jgi:hypothetical protein
MIGMDVAARLIAEWENEVVTQQQVAPASLRNSASPRSPVQPLAGLEQLRNILGGKPTKGDP